MRRSSTSLASARLWKTIRQSVYGGIYLTRVPPPATSLLPALPARATAEESDYCDDIKISMGSHGVGNAVEVSMLIALQMAKHGGE